MFSTIRVQFEYGTCGVSRNPKSKRTYDMLELSRIPETALKGEANSMQVKYVKA